MFRNLTMRQQISLGFGVVLILLTALGIFSFSGVTGIVSEATKMITGSNIERILKEKEMEARKAGK